MKNLIPKAIMPYARLANYCIHGRLDYNEDGLATQNRADFQRDKDFIKAYETALKYNAAAQYQMKWRAHTCCWAAMNAIKLGGDFVECGVSRGFLSRVVLEHAKPTARFYLLDAWDNRMGYSDEYETVKASFADFKNVELIRGEIPGTLDMIKSKKIAYLSIDLNTAKAETETLELLWNKLQTGAMAISDDYGHIQYQETRKAWDAFAKSKNTIVLAMPTGQGVVVKV
jgi:hypothetical protein